MKRKLLLFIFISISIFVSCKNPEVSEIEKIIIDDSFIQKKVSEYDSINTDSSNKFIKITYFLKDKSEVSVFKDSLNRIKAWRKSENGEMVDGNEMYLETGQITSNVKNLNEKIKHYYPDGRVKIRGELKNGERIGEWKFYEYNGKIEQIALYDNKGKLISLKKFD